MVGGAPITKAYADEIGADGYAADASSAVRLVKEVLPPEARPQLRSRGSRLTETGADPRS